MLHGDPSYVSISFRKVYVTLQLMLTYIFMKRPVADLGISGEKRQRLRDKPVFYVSIGELRLANFTLKQNKNDKMVIGSINRQIVNA